MSENDPLIKKSGRGGARVGAGRKPQDPREAIAKKEMQTKRIKFRVDGGKMPLEVLLECMRLHYDAGNIDDAARWAVEAAPYVHSRRAAVSVDDGRRPDPTVLPTPMTPEEWIEAVEADVILLDAERYN